MGQAGADGLPARGITDPLGRVTFSRGPITELAARVVAPAPERAVRASRTRVGPAGGDGPPAGGITGPLGRVTIGRGPVTELATPVVAPAPESAVRAGSTRMGHAGGDGPPAGGITDPLGRETIGGGPVAELATPVVAPAPQSAVRAGSTRMGRAGGERLPLRDAARRGGQAGDRDRSVAAERAVRSRSGHTRRDRDGPGQRRRPTTPRTVAHPVHLVSGSPTAGEPVVSATIPTGTPEIDRLSPCSGGTAVRCHR